MGAHPCCLLEYGGNAGYTRRPGHLTDFCNSTEWSNTFVGRYQGVFSEITTINANPSIAWRVNDMISLRAGFNADSDRVWLALGLNQKIGKKTSIDLGYAHVFFDKAKINRPTNENPALQIVRGSFNTSVHILSVQLNHQF